MRPDELLEVVKSGPSVFRYVASSTRGYADNPAPRREISALLRGCRDGKLDVIVTTIPPEASMVEVNELLEQVRRLHKP